MHCLCSPKQTGSTANHFLGSKLKWSEAARVLHKFISEWQQGNRCIVVLTSSHIPVLLPNFSTDKASVYQTDRKWLPHIYVMNPPATFRKLKSKNVRIIRASTVAHIILASKVVVCCPTHVRV